MVSLEKIENTISKTRVLKSGRPFHSAFYIGCMDQGMPVEQFAAVLYGSTADDLKAGAPRSDRLLAAAYLLNFHERYPAPPDVRTKARFAVEDVIADDGASSIETSGLLLRMAKAWPEVF
jgi:hypothetical protein